MRKQTYNVRVASALGTPVIALVIAAVLFPVGAHGWFHKKNQEPGITAELPASAVEEKLVIPTRDLHTPPAEDGALGEAEAETTEIDANEVIPGGSMARWSQLTAPEYRISPGDVLEFMSFDDETISRPEVIVLYNGHISLPLIPDVYVAGLTREAAIESITEAYKKYFSDPAISLTVRIASGKTFYVLGDVNLPSEFPYRTNLTVIKAINLAGGLRNQTRGGDAIAAAQGSLTKAFIIRHVDGQRIIIECDLRDLAKPGFHDSDTPVFPGDVIYVPEGVNLVYLLGEVGIPSVFQLNPNTTLIQLLSRAGGWNPVTARERRVVLMRQIDEVNSEVSTVNVRELIKKGQDVLLKPGDVIYIPQKPLIRLQQFVQRFTGSTSPMLSLYSQAYDSYYTRRRFELLFNEQNTDVTNTLGLLEGLRTVGQIVAPLTLVP